VSIYDARYVEARAQLPSRLVSEFQQSLNETGRIAALFNISLVRVVTRTRCDSHSWFSQQVPFRRLSCLALHVLIKSKQTQSVLTGAFSIFTAASRHLSSAHY